MKADQLVPEVRVNKNGIPVTKYVRPSGTEQGRNRLPAPSSVQVSTESHEVRIDRLIEKLNLNEPRRTMARNNISSYSLSTLELMESAADWNAQQPEPETMFLYFSIVQSTESALRAVAFCRPMFNMSVTSMNVREISGGLTLLERYKGISAIETISDEEREIVAAFLNITETVFQHGKASETEQAYVEDAEVMYIGDLKLQDVIAANYQQADVIMRHIEERGAADPEAILEVLKNRTALSDGAL